MKQGANRLVRGSNFYKNAKKIALAKDWNFNWKIDTNNVGHNYRKMSENAMRYLPK